MEQNQDAITDAVMTLPEDQINDDDDDQQTRHATWLPRDIRYDETYENSVQDILEHPPTGRHGITILPDESTLDPESGVSIRARDIDLDQLPLLTLDQLPLSLDDTRRVYTSPVPGVRLTHPGGYLEGGPGFAPQDDVFAQDFITHFEITRPEQLRDVRAREIHHHLEEARRRFKARHNAAQHNARIEKEIKTLTDQREMELKIETRMRDVAQARRERKDKTKIKTAG